jgi:hypothetical protein
MTKKWIFPVLIFVLFSGCNRVSQKTSFTNHPPSDNDTIFWIAKWTVIGPFSYDTINQTAKDAFYNKDLDAFNIKDSTFTMGDISSIKEKEKLVSHFVIKNDFLDFITLSGGEIKGLSNYYAYASIESPKDEKTILVTDASSSYSVWLNGEKLLQVRGMKSNNRIADRFIHVNLKKGQNHLFFKVGRDNNQYAWKLIAGFCSETKAKEIYKKNYLKDFITNSIVNDSLIVYSGPYKNADVKITTQQGKKLLYHTNMKASNHTFSVATSPLNDGFYTCYLMLKNDTLSETFFIGDYSQLAKELNSRVKKLKDTNISKNKKSDLHAGLQRVLYLKNYSSIDTTSLSEIQYFSKNRVFWAQSLNKNIESLRNNKNQTGTFLKPYQTDSTESHFLFHVGKETLDKKEIPLLLVAPYQTYTTSMIKSWYIGNLSQIEYDCKLADKYGVMLCWLFMNGKNYTPEAAEAEVVRVLENLKKDYPISPNHTWLLGDCDGARKALALAVSKPDLYCGLTLFSPAYSGIYQIRNLKNKNIYINHGKNDTSSPIEDTRKFVKDATKMGISIIFDETEKGHLNVHRAYRESAFQYIRKIENNKTSNR